MQKYLLLVLLAAALQGAVIRGTVVENQSGRPLARALVVLDPVAGQAGQPRSTRTNLYGAFQFPPVPAGAYLLTASRTGFAPFQYGQKQWKSSAVPFTAVDDDSPLLTIRLPRYGAITGTVLDENDVGLPEYEVVAYRNTRPPQIVTRAKTDDRGMFRLYGLEPGSYLVRSVAKQDEEGGYLPTFSKETQIVDQAYPVDVQLDQQVDRVDIRPMPGRLFTLNVEILAVPPNLPVTMTLASDTGRETVQSANHRFGPLPPGQYELFSQAPVEGRPGMQGEYRKVTIGQDTNIRIVLRQVPEMQFVFSGTVGQSPPQVLARRKDLAGDGPSEVLKIVNNRVQLAPGPWELALSPNPAFFPSTFFGPAYQPADDRRVDGWNLITVGAGSLVNFTISSSPGSVHGSVKANGGPVTGAPVFLEPYDLEPRRRITDPFVTRTDLNGQYHFNGLAAGNYRVLSSFEYRMPDSQTMSTAGAKSVKIDEGHDVQQDLDLFRVQQ